MSKINYSRNSFLLKDIDLLSSRDRIFCNQEKRITKHQSFEPNIKGFKEAISNKSKNETDRKLLVSVLKKQYLKLLEKSELEVVNKRIELLSKNNVFTVTTAHQPVLMAGPLYTIYKIASTINLSILLNKEFNDKEILPIFIIGGEDHDFDEMKSIHLYNKNISWENNESGSVGRMSNQGVQKAIQELKSILGDTPNEEAIIKILETSFTSDLTYAASYQKFIHQLFKDYNLIILNMDDKELKNNFSSIMKAELIYQSSKNQVNDTQEIIAKDGMSVQVFPRDINLFYNRANNRHRIIKENERYTIVDSNIRFTETEILTELQNHPERFSPNVILRPVYQEFILPNLAYIGGGGEIAYWLEINKVFKNYKVPFPILLRRNSALWINRKDQIQMKKLGWTIDQLFKQKEDLKKQYLKLQKATLQTTDLEESIDIIFEKLQTFASKENLDFNTFINGQNTKAKQILLHASKKINQGLKQKHDVQLSRIEKIHNNLFPDQKLQERKNNFIPIYSKWGHEFIDILISNLNPLDFSFIAFQEE